MNKPISPVIVTFKALPGVRVQAIHHDFPACYSGCRLGYGSEACKDDHILKHPSQSCGARNYIWREVPPKE